MAVGEPKKTWTITQSSWTDWTSLDPYYWLEYSFQYAANVNADDELHGVKLAQQAHFNSTYKKCQLISLWNNGVAALPMNWWSPKIMKWTSSGWSSETCSWNSVPAWKFVPWVIFQDYVWYWFNGSAWNWLYRGRVTWAAGEMVIPVDHLEDTDEAISTEDDVSYWVMTWGITAILNYNNSRLVVADGQDIWVYYPELDMWPWVKPAHQWLRWCTGWKKVMHFEAWVTIVDLTCDFQYLKVWAVDEGWSTKVFYYQGNDDLRNTFVYNVIDLDWQKVFRAYSVNGTDYYISSVDNTDWFVNLYKMVWTTPLLLLKQRWGLSDKDINQKAPYFVWPCSIDAAYWLWDWYVADTFWVFKFKQVNTRNDSYDRGYMKWRHVTDDSNTTSSYVATQRVQMSGASGTQPYWLCINQNILYVSTTEWCWATRIYDTGKNWYTKQWVLISREYEGQYWGTVTKMLDEIRLHYELNPLAWVTNWTIEVFVSPNNLWRSTDIVWDGTDWWRKVMEISQTNVWTRTERSNLFNNLAWWDSAFKFDWQTITYAIRITLGSTSEATPIARQIDINYHIKDKTNNVYDIK